MSLPFISILIPCRNEEKFISACLDSLIENDFPKEKVEIYVIDGESEDKTREIVTEYQKKVNFIKLLDNPRKTFPSAINLGVKSSKGDPVLIIGSHAYYDKHYISKCVEASKRTTADNVGGVLITKSANDKIIGEIIVRSLSNKFGVGNSTFRIGSNETREVDTVFGGCYKRNVFNKIGYFNENLISTSDYEFNTRLRRNGGKILLIPEIKAYYFTRSSFRGYLLNNFRNGFWAIYPLAFVNYFPVSLRHLVPCFFVLSLLSCLVLSLFFSTFTVILLLILGLYFILAIYFSLQEKKIILKLLLPFCFFLLHISYGFGSFFALIKLPFSILRKNNL